MPTHDDSTNVALEQYRAYLECLVMMHLDPHLHLAPQFQGKFGLSDIVQETLLEATKNLDQLRALAPEQQRAWLRTAAARNLLDRIEVFKSQMRDVDREKPLVQAADASSVRLQGLLASPDSGPAERLERQQREERVARALARLPQRHRDALVLRHWHGLKLAEIATRLGCTAGAVAGLIRTALEKLGPDLQDLD